MKERTLGQFRVAELGLGCMNASHAYGVPPQPAVAERVLLEALDRGVTLFDTAALYGFGANEELVGRVLGKHRSHIVLATKGGMAGVEVNGIKQRVIDGSPAALRRNCEDSLRRLGTDVIDLYYLHRTDLRNRVPIEDSVGEMSRLREEGKVQALGLSEVSATTLRRAYAVHPITALQSEYSLWTREPEIATLDTCAELGIAFVAFSPLGRGFLGGELRAVSSLHPKDIRNGMPRFSVENYPRNLQLLEVLVEVASELHCTAAQVSLAWLLHRAAHIIPIPGTTRVDHLVQNLQAPHVALDPDVIRRLDLAINERMVIGERYAAATMSEIDTERFA